MSCSSSCVKFSGSKLGGTSSTKPNDDYVSVTKSEPALSLIDDALKNQKMMLHAAMRASVSGGKGSFKGIKPVRAILWSAAVSSNSGAGTALNVNGNFSTTSFPEFTNFATVYDEMRVLSGSVHCIMYMSVAGAVGELNAVSAITFDTSSPTPSTFTYPLQQSYNSGPCILNGLVASAAITGHYGATRFPTRYNFKMPPPLAPITSDDTPGSAWFAMDAGTAPTLFSVLCHVDAAGGTGVSNVVHLIKLNCEFKMRV